MKRKRKLWKKLTAAAISAAMLLCMPGYTYAAEFDSAEGARTGEIFSSGQENMEPNEGEELFSSETGVAQSDNEENLDTDAPDSKILQADTEPSDTVSEPGGCVPYISTRYLPEATKGESYTAQLEGISNSVQGLRWSVGDANALPKGIYLTTDGKLTGTPEESGSFLIQVLADNGEAVAARSLVLAVAPVIPAYEMKVKGDTIDLGNLPSGKRGGSMIELINKGQNPLHVKTLPQCENFELSWYDGAEDNNGTMEPGDYAYISVYSREGLADGYYEEQISIETEEGLTASITLKINIGPASSKDYDLKIYSAVVDEQDFDDPELRVETFVSIENIGQKETKITRDTSMLENFRVDDHSINIDDDEAEDVHRTLKPGESITLCIVPLNHYGSYHEEFYVFTDDGSKFPVSITQEIEDPNYLYNRMKITPKRVKYEESFVFYEEAPKPSEITIENNSDLAVSLFQQGDVGLRIGKLDKTRLEPGESAKFSVQPALGLEAGEYTWAAGVEARSDDGKTAHLTTMVSFYVSPYNYEGSEEIPAVTGLTNGAEKTAEGLRLPYYAQVKGYEGENFSVEVEWKVEDCSYDPEVKEEQIFTVKGSLRVAPEQNNKHLDTSVEIQVQVKAYEPLGQPVIDSLLVRDNYLTAALYDTSNEASGYQFVLVKKEADLEKGNFVKTQNSSATFVTIKTIQKGDYYLHCRAYKKDGDSTTYGVWSEGKPVTIEVVTGKAPKITKATVSGCDVRITVSIPDKAAGFDAVLAKGKSGGTPKDYVITKINQSSDKKTIVLSGAAKGTYYAAVHTYTYQDGRKVLSPWSNLMKVTVKNGRITTSPVIQKVSVSGNTVTAVISRPKGTTGSDWVLGKTISNNGIYDKVYDYAYVQKNKTGTKITFKNVKPGTYYLAGHAYMKGYTKSFTNWSGVRKITVK
ncbi:MAG: hypothetical protein Q4D16_02620 [Eubacteriales bacterium]|nr:hypothetical protein [Eubacteriales bacterium]